MDIILGANSIDRTEHARTVVRKIWQQQADPQHPRQAIPIGIAHHLARYPIVCDDCGMTYWSQDEWSNTHLGCRGTPRTTGF